MDTQDYAGNTSLLDISGLSFRYGERSRWLLRNIDLQIAAGERVGIWGDNGSGKSTLALILLGYLRHASGSICFRGRSPLRRYSHCAWLGYAGDPGFHDEELGLPLGLRLGELLSTVAQLSGNRAADEYQPKLHSLLGLERLKDRLTENLSAGERKRAMLYLALSAAREFLLLDEPTEGLDEDIRDEVLDHIDSYCLRQSCALLYISHRRDELAVVTGRALRMSDGHLVEEPARSVDVRVAAQNDGPTHAGLTSGNISSALLLWRLRRHMRTPDWCPLRVDLRRPDIGL